MLTNDMMTVSEVAEYLRVNPQTIYRKAKAGELPVVRIGRAIRFRRSDLEACLRSGQQGRQAWLKGLQVEQPPPVAVHLEENPL